MVPWHTLSFSLRHNQGCSEGECSCSSRRTEVEDSFSCGDLFFVKAESWRITRARPSLGATIQCSVWAVPPRPWGLAQLDGCYCFPVPHRGTQLSLGSYKKLPFLAQICELGYKNSSLGCHQPTDCLGLEKTGLSPGKAGASLGMENVNLLSKLL